MFLPQHYLNLQWNNTGKSVLLCTVTALSLPSCYGCIIVRNQLTISTLIQSFEIVVFTKLLEAGINFNRADIAVGLRLIMLKNPVQI